MAERCIGGDEDEQWPWQEGGNTCGLHFWWCYSSTLSIFPGWKPNV
jgi:hypothetical protein